MKQMEQIFANAAANKEISGVVLLAADKHDRFRYANSFGYRSLKDLKVLMNLDTPIWMASWTKLMTAIATLQCVENNVISLDQDVTSILPELGRQPILQGFDDRSGKPILKKRQNPITVSQLLTHTAGLSYDIFSPLLRKWRSYKDETPADGSSLIEKFSYPLLYEPGTSWEYSGAFDWLGICLERVTGCVPLGTYMKTHIWDPLSLYSMTFRPNDNPVINNNLAALSIRDSSGSGKVLFATNPLAKVPATEDGGGGGAYGLPTEFMKILGSLMKNDGKLLKPEMVDFMFKPRLEDLNRSKSGVRRVMIPTRYDNVEGFPKDTKKDWSIAGLINREDLEGWRKKGSVTCFGMANACWWMDREAGLYGLYATGTFPANDTKSIALRRGFEMEMYKRFAPARTKL